MRSEVSCDPLNAAPTGTALVDYDFVGLSSVNVTDSTQYAQADRATLEAFGRTHCSYPVKSLETTHGLIRAQSNAPFLYISGITDRVGYFDTDVKPRSYAQNTASAHNAGIVLGELLTALSSSGFA